MPLAITLAPQEQANAPECVNCFGYVEEPECLIVERDGEWLHLGSGESRCAGQEDDDTNDVATPDRY